MLETCKSKQCFNLLLMTDLVNTLAIFYEVWIFLSNIDPDASNYLMCETSYQYVWFWLQTLHCLPINWHIDYHIAMELHHYKKKLDLLWKFAIKWIGS